MSKKKKGNRYILLIPKRAMGRLWKPSFFLGLLLAVLLWQAESGNLIKIDKTNQGLLVAAMVFALLFGLFTLAAQNMNYIQPCASHFRVVTPFLRLKISYRRIRSSHSVNFNQTYPLNEMRWAQKRFFKPFSTKTALAINLTGYPLPPKFLRLFLPKQVFLPSETGFLLVVEDWMTLSTEIDSFAGTWRSRRKR